MIGEIQGAKLKKKNKYRNVIRAGCRSVVKMKGIVSCDRPDRVKSVT